ncbi:hypothetical protein [Gemelliphila palaticanis]|uniref:IrrE N-terminal-like domain-containing protein n=1 Tax=Gemelliphila palaticanis TaxID=81950 RepID=A0ABX2T3G7_9BACL|nr:hypothetical protein [Gemella palaticanis]MBF0716064.1 hypothetical protein [Gemella palaticanis]NYS47994.1 hypothetical protein [Gemella palaticanis]
MDTQYINGICINTKIIDFPTSRVKGCVTKNEDDSYTIFLNAKMGYWEMKKTFDHEISHIINEDFEKYNVDEIEYARHSI